MSIWKNTLLLSLFLGAWGGVCGVYLPDVSEGNNLTVRDHAGNRNGYLGSKDASASSVPVRSEVTRFGAEGRRALHFSGKSGYGNQVLTLPALQEKEPFSVCVEAWFKPDAMPDSFVRLFCLGDAPEKEGNGFRLYTKKDPVSGTVRLIWALRIQGKVYELGTPPETSVFSKGKDSACEWVHIAADYNRTNGLARIFVNGKAVASATFPKGGIGPSGKEITVGNRAQSDRGFSGLIDEVKVVAHPADAAALGFNRSFASDRKPSTQKVFEWEGSRYGITEKVPPPWKNVEVRKEKNGRLIVTASGKDFHFSDSVLPERIVYGKEEMLSAPFSLELNGKKLEAKPNSLRVLSATPREVRLSSFFLSDEGVLSGELSIEFDGVSGLTFVPGDKMVNRRVSSFRTRIFLPRCLTPLAKVGGDAGLLDKRLSKGWAFPLWTGGEKSGLTVYAESDQWWVNPKPREAFVIVPEKKDVELTVNFIAADTTFKPGSRFKFFFQPTPIKEFPRARPEAGFFHGAFLDMEKTPSSVDCTYDADGILKRDRGTLDILLEPMFDQNAKMKRLLGREPYIREIFSVVTLGQEHFRLCYSIPHGGLIADEGIQPSSEAIWDGTRKILFSGKYVFEKGKMSRLTLCWGDGKLRCFVNGKQIAECDRKNLFEGKIVPDLDGKLQIRFGESVFNFLAPRFGAGFRIAGVRLMDEISLPETGNAAPDHCRGTVLLDRFTKVEKCRDGMKTTPETGPCGNISAGGRIVGGALELFQNPGDMKASCLDRVAETLSTALIFHQGWSSIQSHYCPEDPQKLRSLIDACHRKNLKLMLYFGFELSEKAPEFEKWHKDALRVHPDRPVPELPRVRFDQKCGKVCYGGIWQDFITFAIEKTRRDYPFDGVFLDAAMVPYPCPNERHGCGWRDSSGKLHATMPVHRYLEMIRRIHQIVRERGGLITGNQASGPLWGYPDSVWVGEGYKYKELGANPGKAISLPEWRVNFAGRTQGTPGELLLYEYPPFWRRDAGWALAGLHGMFVRPEIWWRGSYLEKLARMRRVFQSCGIDKAEFVGYYEIPFPIKSNSPDVLVSFYRIPDGLLLWVVNLGLRETEASLALDSSLQCPEGTIAEAPLTGATFKVHQGKLVFPLHPCNWRMLKITLSNNQKKGVRQ